MAKRINYASMFTLRKDGRYQGSYTDATGRHYVYDRDPEKLWHKLNDPPEDKPILFGDIAEMWHDKHWERIRDGTKACYNSSYARAVELFGNVPATEVAAADIYNHLVRLKDQSLSAKTIKTQRTIYKLIYENAIIDAEIGKKIRENPANNVPLPKAIKPPVKRSAPENSILQKIRDSATTTDFGLFALLLVSTGFRRGEALALKWEDIDFENKSISCIKSISFRGTAKEAGTKTEAGIRAVPLLPDLESVLKKPDKAKSTDYIFHSADPSKCMCESTYRRRWLNYCREMGFAEDHPEEVIVKGKKKITHHYKPTLTAHFFRHGYATMLYDAGVDVYTAQKLLGHANVETTIAIYTHLRKERETASIDKLRAYISGGKDVVQDVKSSEKH